MLGQDALKRMVAEAAAGLVQPGMRVGLGTGSTAALMIEALIGRERAEGLACRYVPTSERSGAQARAGGLDVVGLEQEPVLDIALDGADQIAAGSLDCIKGMGGALLREKIVATAAARFVVMADQSKMAGALRLPVPVEVVRFGWQATLRRVEALGCAARPRMGEDGIYITDGGDVILDCDFGVMADPAATSRGLREVVGVIETGLFVGMASEVLVPGQDGLRRFKARGSAPGPRQGQGSLDPLLK